MQKEHHICEYLVPKTRYIKINCIKLNKTKLSLLAIIILHLRPINTNYKSALLALLSTFCSRPRRWVESLTRNKDEIHLVNFSFYVVPRFFNLTFKRRGINTFLQPTLQIDSLKFSANRFPPIKLGSSISELCKKEAERTDKKFQRHIKETRGQKTFGKWLLRGCFKNITTLMFSCF